MFHTPSQAPSIAMTTPAAPLIHNFGMRPSAGTRPDGSASFAHRLREALERKGVNPNQIEVELEKRGIRFARQTIYAMLSGSTGKPTWDKLVLLCEVLGVRPEWLAEGELPMHPAPVLDDAEIQLIQNFRAMSHPHKRDLADIAERWADGDTEDPKPSEHRAPPARQ